ncbi:MAG: Shedu immune nuclease family protein [Candidatus Izemoplasmatales bacterium]
MESISTKSVGKNIASIEEDFVLSEEPMSRLVFRAQIHSKGIRGRIVRQRRESEKDDWVPDKAIDIRDLGKNEFINIDLPTKAVKNFDDAINKLTKILNDQGIKYGRATYITAEADNANQVIITNKNKAIYINKLLSEGYSEEVWASLVEKNPNLATKLSMGRIQAIRSNVLNFFNKAIKNLDELTKFKKHIEQPSCKDETAWQVFMQRNQWIFGYGLDYRFLSILQREFHASDTEADGSDGVIGDYLMGDNKFTTFVEVKLPTTPLFGNSKNRSGCWKLSNDLMDAVSQILEQKSKGEIKIETSKILHDENGHPITQRAYNSKVILIIGNWTEIEQDTPKIKTLKEKTFELFRRELKNIDILTYDELYNRAEFIINNRRKK